MTLSDIVSMLDKKYHTSPVPCPNEGVEVKMRSNVVSDVHGNLTVHGTGNYLVCGRCGYNVAVGRPN